MSSLARVSVSIDRYRRSSHGSSIASCRPVAWKHVVGRPYSAANHASKYAPRRPTRRP